MIHTTQTNANGGYTFNQLTPGTYNVRELQPNGYYYEDAVPGSVGGTASDDHDLTQISLPMAVNAAKLQLLGAAAGRYLRFCLLRCQRRRHLRRYRYSGGGRNGHTAEFQRSTDERHGCHGRERPLRIRQSAIGNLWRRRIVTQRLFRGSHERRQQWRERRWTNHRWRQRHALARTPRITTSAYYCRPV